MDEGVPHSQPVGSPESDSDVEQDEVLDDDEDDGSLSSSEEARLAEYLESKDLEWFFNMKGVQPPARVAQCRAYASWVVANGHSGRTRPGPPPEAPYKSFARTPAKRTRR